MFAISPVHGRHAVIGKKAVTSQAIPRFGGSEPPLSSDSANKPPVRKLKFSHVIQLVAALLGTSGAVVGGKAYVNQTAINDNMVAIHSQQAKAQNQLNEQLVAQVEQNVKLAAEVRRLSNQVTLTHITDAVRKIAPSTVEVLASDGLGSGVIVTGVNGKKIIITNGHVIEPNGDTPITAQTPYLINLYNGTDKKAPRQFDTHLVSLPNGKLAHSPSDQHDLALLEIPKGVKLPKGAGAIPLRDLKKYPLQVGEAVIAIGNPEGLRDSVSAGIISHVDRKFGDFEVQNVFIQHTAPINPGNSGGGLFTVRMENGKPIIELIGINTMRITGDDGLGGAIHTDIVRQFLKDPASLIKKKPQITIQFKKVDPTQYQV